MKRLIFLSLVLAMAVACDPLDDVRAVLDEERASKSENSENRDYTLVADDYATLSKTALAQAVNATDSSAAKKIKEMNAMNDRFTAKALVGDLLAKKFPGLKKSSTVKLTYNTYLADINYLADIENAIPYKLTPDDYLSVDENVGNNGFFIPSIPADEHLSAILGDTLKNCKSGDYAIVQYRQSDFEISPMPKSKVLLNEDFSTYAKFDTVNKNGWIAYVELEARNQDPDKKFYNVWQVKEYDENLYAQFTANYSDSMVISWLITPEIDLTDAISANFSFDVKVDYWNANCLQVKASSTFDESNPNANWDTDLTSNFTLPEEPASGFGSAFASAGIVDLSAFVGKKIRLAFRYEGTGKKIQDKDKSSTTYQIDNVNVTAKYAKTGAKGLQADLYKEYIDVYRFNGTKWAKAKGVRAIHPFEYAEMGLKFPNFSKTTPADHYIPIFLNRTYPYALDGDSISVAYYFFVNKSTTSTVVDRYVKVQGQWTRYIGVVTKTDQFMNSGEKWVFDPTIKFSPSSADYDLVLQYVKSTYGDIYIDPKYGNSEYYYGMSPYYNNVNLKLSYRDKLPEFANLSEEAATKLAWERAEQGLCKLLELKFPDATALLPATDIPVYYWITFNTYLNDGSKPVFTGVFQFDENDKCFKRMHDVEKQEVSNGNLSPDMIAWPQK